MPLEDDIKKPSASIVTPDPPASGARCPPRFREKGEKAAQDDRRFELPRDQPLSKATSTVTFYAHRLC